MKTIVAHLVSLGWTDPVAAIRGATVQGGPKGGPALVIAPRKATGAPAIDLRAALPAGARVDIAGNGAGVVEYSDRTYYVRFAADMPHVNPVDVLASMLDAGATIDV